MKFLVDASCDARIAIHLNTNGHDATRVGTDYQADLPDIELLDIALREGRVLITDDRDFGELVFRLRRPHAGVIYLRVGTTDIEYRCRRLDEALDSMKEPVQEFIVVSRDEVRIRRP